MIEPPQAYSSRSPARRLYATHAPQTTNYVVKMLLFPFAQFDLSQAIVAVGLIATASPTREHDP
jgi:hypothetical protein